MDSIVSETRAGWRAIVLNHLDREEALVIPVFLELKPDELWSLF